VARYSDDELGMDAPITRRDFVNGMAVGAVGIAAAGALGGVAEAAAKAGGGAVRAGNPPAEHGVVGQIDAARNLNHAVVSGRYRTGRVRDLREDYDVVIVGGGISGIASAWWYRERFGRNARILLLDPLHDFGGHAHRNEFSVRGTRMLSNGGTVNIDGFDTWNQPAQKLFAEIGFDIDRFPERTFAGPKDRGYFFPAEHFGRDQVVVRDRTKPVADFVAMLPYSDRAKADIVKILTGTDDYLPGRSDADKKALLSRISYKQYLTDHVGVSEEAIGFIQRDTHGLWGVGPEAVPAGDCWAVGQPGFDGLNLVEEPYLGLGKTPVQELTAKAPVVAWPDGNASVARMMVSRLVPGVFSGPLDPDGVVAAKASYGRLDHPGNRVRIRLNSSAIKVVPGRARGDRAEVVYVDVRSGKAFRLRPRHVVMACWTAVSSHIVKGLPAGQVKAMRYAKKIPLVYARAAIRDWKAFEQAGFRNARGMKTFWDSMSLSAGEHFGSSYAVPDSSDSPAVVTFSKTPNKPGVVPQAKQFVAGRQLLMATRFAEYERQMRDMLARTLGPHGFDPRRDIAEITVNRWAHGYAYEYNSIDDKAFMFKPESEHPHMRARKPLRNVAIANSDAGAFAYTHSAIDQAFRAVGDLPGR
jgi:spermidine dehydrogenase